ncbi:hypothetical protein [Tranquillimonas alkanivorans]|uniref:hypothetical protein n=1 Tax=Tranquillimonas alkanivorans TaxID=441119 RepID=UPI001C4322EB|nr:hypothetical protein [Tranquillimonas alkanivorans]
MKLVCVPSDEVGQQVRIILSPTAITLRTLSSAQDCARAAPVDTVKATAHAATVAKRFPVKGRHR